MPKYDVYVAPNGKGLVLDVQTDLLAGIKSRVVVPLVPPKLAPPTIRRLNPVFTILGAEHVMVTQSLAAVPTTLLTTPQANLAEHFAEITDALDMLLQGF